MDSKSGDKAVPIFVGFHTYYGDDPMDSIVERFLNVNQQQGDIIVPMLLSQSWYFGQQEAGNCS